MGKGGIGNGRSELDGIERVDAGDGGFRHHGGSGHPEHSAGCPDGKEGFPGSGELVPGVV